MGNYTNAIATAVVSGFSIVFTTLAVATRLFVKIKLVRHVTLDDYLLITAQIFGLLSSAVLLRANTVNLKYNLEGDALFIDPIGSFKLVATILKYFWLSELFYCITTMFIRASVAVLLTHIARRRIQLGIIWTALACTTLVSVMFFLAIILQCNPPEYYWTKFLLTKGTCARQGIIIGFSYGHTVTSFVADCIFALIPIWLLWNVKISWQRKVGIASLLGMGLLAGIAALIRVPYIHEVAKGENFIVTWPGLVLGSIIEIILGITAASFAAFRPLFKTKWFVKRRGDWAQRTEMRNERRKDKKNAMTKGTASGTKGSTTRTGGTTGETGSSDMEKGENWEEAKRPQGEGVREIPLTLNDNSVA